MLHVYLAHGASGDAASMAPWVDGLIARGYAATAVQLPKRKAEDVVDVYAAQVVAGGPVVVGGHSFGGRVASLLVASDPGRFAGLVCLSYPAHAPGKPENAAARTAHWPRITVPALLLSGTGDPFARLDLLQGAMPSLPDGRLVTYPRLGHSLKPVLGDALDRIAAFLAELEPPA